MKTWTNPLSLPALLPKGGSMGEKFLPALMPTNGITGEKLPALLDSMGEKLPTAATAATHQ